MNSRFLQTLRSCFWALVVFHFYGCDLFAPRIPENPLGNGGTWLQPDTPDRVIENLRNAISERNVQHYTRSLAANLVFTPTISAENRDPVLWTKWGITEEENYFARLATDASLFTGHRLDLFETSQIIIDNRHVAYQATYTLQMQHSRSSEGIPVEVKGKVVWNLSQQPDGLWKIERWADQSLNGVPSWSDLKAAFIK